MDLFKFKIDCETAMNELLDHLERSDSISKKAIYNAFNEISKIDSTYSDHLTSAHIYNDINNVRDLLDYACACDFLMEFNGNFVAIDWTDNSSEIINKVDKHKWLKPLYEIIDIKYTLVVKANGYLNIRNNHKGMMAKFNTSGVILKKLDAMHKKKEYNSSLEFTVKTTL